MKWSACTSSTVSQPVYFLSESYTDGAEFLTLTESEVKAMVPAIGLARKVMQLLTFGGGNSRLCMCARLSLFANTSVKLKGLMYSVLSWSEMHMAVEFVKSLNSVGLEILPPIIEPAAVALLCFTRPRNKLLKRIPHASMELAAKRSTSVLDTALNKNVHKSWSRLFFSAMI